MAASSLPWNTIRCIARLPWTLWGTILSAVQPWRGISYCILEGTRIGRTVYLIAAHLGVAVWLLGARISYPQASGVKVWICQGFLQSMVVLPNQH